MARNTAHSSTVSYGVICIIAEEKNICGYADFFVRCEHEKRGIIFVHAFCYRDRATRATARNRWVLKKKRPNPPTENVFREGFLVIFYLYVVAWDEKSSEKARTTTGQASCVACLSLRIHRVIDGRAREDEDARALFGDMVGSDVYLRVRTLFSRPLSLRVATYERTSVSRGPDSIQHVGFCSQRYSILETERNEPPPPSRTR